MTQAILGVMIIAVMVVYFILWMACLFHFNGKFNHYAAKLKEAHRKGNLDEQRLYFRAEQLASVDTAASMFWPSVIRRWNVDHVAEARRERL